MSPPLPTGAELERALEIVEMQQYEDFFEALPRNVAQAVGLDLHRDRSGLRLTARGFDHPMFNRVMGAGLDPRAEPPEAVLDRAQEHYEVAGVRRWMLQLLPHVEPDGFREVAASRGVIPLRGWAKHLGSTEQEIPFRTDLRVVRLGPKTEDMGGDARGLADAWADIVVRNFGLPPAFASWLRALYGRERWLLYLALDGKTPVATGALHLSSGEVGLIGQLNFASTLPEHRRKGAQSALVARRVSDARTAGAGWIVCETDEESPDRPNPSTRNLVRFGFPVSYVRANWGPPKPSD